MKKIANFAETISQTFMTKLLAAVKVYLSIARNFKMSSFSCGQQKAI